MTTQQTPWQKYIEANADYIEMLYTDPNFQQSLLKFWITTLESFTFTLVNTSEKVNDNKINLDVLRGKILAYTELVQTLEILRRQKEQLKQRCFELEQQIIEKQ